MLERHNPENADWHLLLNFLAGDSEDPQTAYLAARERLERLFQWKGSDRADELVDVTLDRVAAKLKQETIRAAPMTYVLGVARLVFLEHARAENRTRDVHERHAHEYDVHVFDDAKTREAWLRALETCMKKLKPDKRQLIQAYYGYGTGERAGDREKLAIELGIPLNALRLRARRIRVQLEACTQKKLATYDMP